MPQQHLNDSQKEFLKFTVHKMKPLMWNKGLRDECEQRDDECRG